MFPGFKDRSEAGQKLADILKAYDESDETLTLALPRGGVPVAFEVANILSLPMDIWLVRKLGVPGHEELAMGAIALNGACHINRDIALGMGITDRLLNQVITRERQELARRNKRYRQGRDLPTIKNRTVIVVDDGLATGATMLAAIQSLRQAKAGKIVVAVPVSATTSYRDVEEAADEIYCLQTPEPFFGVGQWYRDFAQLSDEDVLDYMDRYQELQEQNKKNAIKKRAAP